MISAGFIPSIGFHKDRQRPKLLEATPLILQDNAMCHKAGNIQAVFTEYNGEVLQHPPYLPDSSPCDYDLFLKIKEPFCGICCDDLDELYAALNGVEKGINVRFLAMGIQKLPKEWKSTIWLAGN